MLTQTREGDQSVSLVLRENMFVAEIRRFKCQKNNIADKISRGLSDSITSRHPTQIPPGSKCNRNKKKLYQTQKKGHLTA